MGANAKKPGKGFLWTRRNWGEKGKNHLHSWKGRGGGLRNKEAWVYTKRELPGPEKRLTSWSAMEGYLPM